MASDPRKSKPFASLPKLVITSLLGQELTAEESILITDYVVNMANAEKPWASTSMLPDETAIIFTAGDSWERHNHFRPSQCGK